MRQLNSTGFWTWLMVIATIITIVILLYFIADILAFGSAAEVYAQNPGMNGTGTSGSGSGSNNLVTEGEVQSMDITNDATVATVGGGIASGLVAEFLARRKKAGKVDNALKDKDKLIKKLFDNQWKLVHEAMAEGNATKPFREIILLKAHPENNLDKRTIADVINEDREKFEAWYEERYKENPK